MSPSTDFEDTWYPRIGEDAAEKLRRSGRAFWFFPLAWILAASAGLLIGRSPLGDVIGCVLIAGSVVCLLLLITARWPTAAAISEWYGVPRMRMLPSMRPEHFDRLRKANGYMTPDERHLAAAGQPPDWLTQAKRRIDCSVPPSAAGKVPDGRAD